MALWRAGLQAVGAAASSRLRDHKIDHLADGILGAVACDDNGPKARVVEGASPPRASRGADAAPRPREPAPPPPRGRHGGLRAARPMGDGGGDGDGVDDGGGGQWRASGKSISKLS